MPHYNFIFTIQSNPANPVLFHNTGCLQGFRGSNGRTGLRPTATTCEPNETTHAFPPEYKLAQSNFRTIPTNELYALQEELGRKVLYNADLQRWINPLPNPPANIAADILF